VRSPVNTGLRSLARGNVHCSRAPHYDSSGMGIWSPYFGGRTKLQKVLRVLVFISILLPLTFLLLLFINDVTTRVLGKGREFGVWWVLFGSPLIAELFGWLGLWQHRKSEPDLLAKSVAMLATTGAVLLAVGEIAYVQFVRDLSWQEGGGVVGWMLLLSLLGFVGGLFALRSPRWFSVLTLATAAWMLALSFLSGMAL
jgi:hypothetical protein